MVRYIALMVLLFAVLNGVQAEGTRPAVKPFIMPVAGPSGPSTWILGQPYGNTTGAYLCGTPLTCCDSRTARQTGRSHRAFRRA